MSALRAIFFDMDGTITRPFIDWRALRAELGAPVGTPIMEYVENLQGKERQRAEETLLRTEMEAAERAALNPGAAELVAGLRRRALRLALITNNHRRAMHRVVERFSLHFDLLLSREDAPLKPAPDLLLLALKRLDLRPGEARFVGDGSYDRQASQAAGVPFIHLAHDPPQSGDGPTIRALDELWQVLGL